MKFTEGHWKEKEGLIISKPQEVIEYYWRDNSLYLYVAHRKVEARSNTLSNPITTVKIECFRQNIFKVTNKHFMGEKQTQPTFDIDKEDISDELISISFIGNKITLINNKIKAEIDLNPFSIAFYFKEKLLTKTGPYDSAHILNTNDKKSYMRERLSLGIGECVYGLGERFTPFIKNGQSVESWNCDGGTSSEKAYKNIPFYLTDSDYGIFVNHTENVSFEIASEAVQKVQFSIEGESLEYCIVGGNSMKDVIGGYTSLTGRPPLLPKWSYGLWLTTSFTTDYNEITINEVIDGMKERGIDLSVFHFDCFWMKRFNWCDFEWDKQKFPNPRQMIDRLKKKGLKICVWINPYIAQMSKLFNEAKNNNYLIKKENGDIYQTNVWQAGMGIVDFTNPEACIWYERHLQRLIDMGVDSFKTDFGEEIPTDVIYYDNSDPFKIHNYYSLLYNKVVFNLLEKNHGKNEALVFARSATAGCQKYPVHWGGDCCSSYASMAETLRGGLSLALCGFAYWSHDISGFEDFATPDLYKRWVAFGLLSSHSRLHGDKSYRVPWLFDEEAVEVLKFFVQLKKRLLPYIMNVANNAHETGLPIIRPMIIEFQDDFNCRYIDTQFMLGSKLLVAPIFNDNHQARYYLPEGEWEHIIDGRVLSGGRWYEEKYGYKSLPIFCKKGEKHLVI